LKSSQATFAKAYLLTYVKAIENSPPDALIEAVIISRMKIIVIVIAANHLFLVRNEVTSKEFLVTNSFLSTKTLALLWKNPTIQRTYHQNNNKKDTPIVIGKDPVRKA